MSTKEWVKHLGDYGIYQECLYDFDKYDINPNPASIQITYPDDFHIERETLKGDAWSQLTVDIPAEIFDEIAIAWIKKRNLTANKYTLDELLEKGNFKWPISEEELIEGLDEAADNIDLTRIAKERGGQEEVEASLEMDNIFKAVTDSKEEAKRLKTISDEMIRQREVKELKGLFKDYSGLKGCAQGILKHIKENTDIDDEQSLLNAIEQELKVSIVALRITNERLE